MSTLPLCGPRCPCGNTDTYTATFGADETSGLVAVPVVDGSRYYLRLSFLDADGTYEALIAKFNGKYPDVTVEVQSITDYAGELATRMQTKEYGVHALSRHRRISCDGAHAVPARYGFLNCFLILAPILLILYHHRVFWENGSK